MRLCPLHPVHRVNLVNPAPIFRIRVSETLTLLSYPINLVFLSHGNGSVKVTESLSREQLKVLGRARGRLQFLRRHAS